MEYWMSTGCKHLFGCKCELCRCISKSCKEVQRELRGCRANKGEMTCMNPPYITYVDIVKAMINMDTWVNMGFYFLECVYLSCTMRCPANAN